VILTKRAQNKPDPQIDGVVAAIEDEIYYQEVRDLENERDEQNEKDKAACNDANPHGTADPENVDLDPLHTVRIGSRSTTFRIDGKPVTFGEFRHAAKKRGVAFEKRLKLDNKPERFISRGDVRAEQ
jgi:formylglycine-generating enzyme required for sulfatase activity